MTVEVTRPSVEVDSSIGNLFDKSILYTAAWPVEAFVDTIQKSGYRGLEWHPLRGIFAGAQMSLGLVSKHSKDAVRSLHQSYRSEKSLREAWHHPNRSLAMISYVLLPERVSSLNDLERLQRVVGRELPVVLYPENPGEESGTSRKFAEKTFQPTPEVMHRWNVKTVEELATEAYKRGYTGLCVDLFHMRAQNVGEIGLSPWQETLPQLLPHAQEIHVAVGRTDIKQGQIDTEQELRDLLSGRGDSELLEMLRMIRESKWTGRIVTEIPAFALHAVRASRSTFSSVNDLIEDHRRIVGNIQDLLA